MFLPESLWGSSMKSFSLKVKPHSDDYWRQDQIIGPSDLLKHGCLPAWRFSGSWFEPKWFWMYGSFKFIVSAVFMTSSMT